MILDQYFTLYKHYPCNWYNMKKKQTFIGIRIQTICIKISFYLEYFHNTENRQNAIVMELLTFLSKHFTTKIKGKS